MRRKRRDSRTPGGRRSDLSARERAADLGLGGTVSAGAARQRDSWFFGATSAASGIALTGHLAYPSTTAGGLAGKRQVGTLRVRYVP